MIWLRILPNETSVVRFGISSLEFCCTAESPSSEEICLFQGVPLAFAQPSLTPGVTASFQTTRFPINQFMPFLEIPCKQNTARGKDFTFDDPHATCPCHLRTLGMLWWGCLGCYHCLSAITYPVSPSSNYKFWNLWSYQQPMDQRVNRPPSFESRSGLRRVPNIV